MSKSLKNAIAVLRAKGIAVEEIQELVEEYLTCTFISCNNIHDRLDELVASMPGWTIVDRNLSVIVNEEGQQIWFGSSTSGSMCVSQKNFVFQKGEWGPPGFTTSPLSIPDLVLRIKKIKLTIPSDK